MPVLAPYHQDEWLPGLAAQLPDRAWSQVRVELPSSQTGWARLAPLYRGVAEAVAADHTDATRLVVSGCCCMSLGVVAGLQRAGIDAGVVWFDAHGDVQTMETSTSGYLGGMPLRILTGYRPELVADQLGLAPVAEDRVVLVDARDLDPPEREYLDRAGIRRSTVEDLAAPDWPVVLHIDLDVIDAAQLAGLRFPVPGGPSRETVVAAVRTLMESGRVVALDLACTWDPTTPDPSGSRTRLVAELLDGL